MYGFPAKTHDESLTRHSKWVRHALEGHPYTSSPGGEGPSLGFQMDGVPFGGFINQGSASDSTGQLGNSLYSKLKVKEEGAKK
mgnify:CR=1 FL=1